MKTILSLFVFASIVFSSCDRHPAKVTVYACNRLITDTAGTNDTAKIFMVTAFTPNNDGLNDICRPFIKGASSMSFKLYNDDGVLVFATNTPGEGFSLAAVPATYIRYAYSIQITTLEGHQLGECGNAYAFTCIPSFLSSTPVYYEDELQQDGFHAGTTHEQIPPCP